MSLCVSTTCGGCDGVMALQSQSYVSRGRVKEATEVLWGPRRWVEKFRSFPTKEKFRSNYSLIRYLTLATKLKLIINQGYNREN